LQDRYGESPYVIRLGYVADDLAVFFKAAFCYCQPSFYEGFGLSVLDALFSKTPVVCAKTQALTEIYGDTCTYFDPKNVQSLVLAIENITNHIDTKEHIVAGYKLAKAFSWEKTAEQTYEVYKKVISN
jgi:glycosyltransferase involved in cell wall biosynthesis